MKIHVQFEAQLRQAAGLDQEETAVDDGCSLQQALQQLADSHGDALSSRLLTADRAVQPSVLIFVNSQAVSAAASESHVLQDGDEVLLCPPISGG